MNMHVRARRSVPLCLVAPTLPGPTLPGPTLSGRRDERTVPKGRTGPGGPGRLSPAARRAAARPKRSACGRRSPGRAVRGAAGRRRDRLRPGADPGRAAGAVGAGPDVRAGDGATPRPRPRPVRRRPRAGRAGLRAHRDRRAVGDGGGAGMRRTRRGHRRDPGRSEGARPDRDQASRPAGGARRPPGGADPLRRRDGRALGRPLALADRLGPLRPPSARPAGAGRAALAGGAVPGAGHAPRHVGGAL